MSNSHSPHNKRHVEILRSLPDDCGCITRYQAQRIAELEAERDKYKAANQEFWRLVERIKDGKADLTDLFHSRFIKPGHDKCTESSCVLADTDPCE